MPPVCKAYNPANTRRSPNAGSMLGRFIRRRVSIDSTLGQRLVFARKIAEPTGVIRVSYHQLRLEKQDATDHYWW